MKQKTIDSTWELWSYDVWGNAKEGYDVNNRAYFNREYPIRLKVGVYNIGTPRQFESAHPTDYQIRKAFGVGCKIDTDGDDMTIYVNRASDNYPIGEMHCTSHKALSPIRKEGGD